MCHLSLSDPNGWFCQNLPTDRAALWLWSSRETLSCGPSGPLPGGEGEAFSISRVSYSPVGEGDLGCPPGLYREDGRWLEKWGGGGPDETSFMVASSFETS